MAETRVLELRALCYTYNWIAYIQFFFQKLEISLSLLITNGKTNLRVIFAQIVITPL